jgi:O-Antigen ligase
MEVAAQNGSYSYVEAKRPGAWPAIAATLILGYFCLSRAFAYVGIPPWKVFVSEVVLALFLFFGPKVGDRCWLRTALQLPALRQFSIAYSVFFAYGILQILHGTLVGNPAFTALRDLAFNYYPLYIFIGLWAGLTRPELLPKLLRGFAWFNGVYGTLYLLVLNGINWFVPGVADEISPVPIFGQPVYSFVALLGIIAYEQKPWRSWHLLALNSFVMLGMQLRTEWLAFAIGLITWFILTRQGKRLLQAGAIFAVFFALLYITDLRLPGPEGRGGGEISVRQLTDRALAPFRANTSDVVAAAGVGAETQEATFVWRTVWWLLIWNSVHADLPTAFWGFGYGYPLGDLAPYLRGQFLRTPHNTFFYALGYTGWIGVAVLFLFQAAIFHLLWKANHITKRPFGISFWVAIMAYGMFFPLGETPYGAIPFYLMIGWLAAPILSDAQPAHDALYLAPEELFPRATSSFVLHANPGMANREHGAVFMPDRRGLRFVQ